MYFKNTNIYIYIYIYEWVVRVQLYNVWIIINAILFFETQLKIDLLIQIKLKIGETFMRILLKGKTNF